MSFSGSGESRTELLSWLNDLLKLNYNKVEQCGTGAAYCQILDSIYRDVPMHRVKFDAQAEYESLTNFKILQSCFIKHKIEKTVFVDRLIKCKFQDNLEFLQWLKRFWVQNKDGSVYESEFRRKCRPTSMASHGIQASKKRTLRASSSSRPASNLSSSVSQSHILHKTRGSGQNIGSILVEKSSSSNYLVGTNKDQVDSLQSDLERAGIKMEKMSQEMSQYQDAMAIMERERDFYFGKLRDIEILVQSTQDLYKEGVYNDDPQELNRFLGKVNLILYSTEEGFEVSGGLDRAEAGDRDQNKTSTKQEIACDTAMENLITDEETF